MSAPIKEGLDYFTCDCNFEDNVELIIAEFGLKGLGILIRLWQKIYGFGGYYSDWNEDVALMFASKNGVSVGTVSEIISACVRRGIFDRGMLEHCGILTSEGIQKRYFEATKRRQQRNVRSEYLLIELPTESINVNNNSINVNNNSINVCNNSQSKVNKSKVKKRKAESVAPTLEEVKQFANEEQLCLDAGKFYRHYSATGWKIGNSPIVDWKAKARQWSAEDKAKQPEQPSFDVARFEQYVDNRELAYRKES